MAEIIIFPFYNNSLSCLENFLEFYNIMIKVLENKEIVIQFPVSYNSIPLTVLKTVLESLDIMKKLSD